jgi:hypothetical protein
LQKQYRNFIRLETDLNCILFLSRHPDEHNTFGFDKGGDNNEKNEYEKNEIKIKKKFPVLCGCGVNTVCDALFAILSGYQFKKDASFYDKS